MSERPRLSGWCSPSDQFHDGCRSAACECPNHPRYAEYVFPLGVGVEGEWPSDQERAK